MRKRLKGRSYKISSRIALSCLVAGTVVLNNGITVRALEVNNNASSANESKALIKEEHKFLVDEDIKSYHDISKIKEFAGFDFKLPNCILDGDEVGSLQLIKTADNKNAIQIYFHNNNNYKNDYDMEIFQTDPEETLKKINELHGYSKEMNTTKQSLTIGGLNGEDITLTITSPKEEADGYVIDESKETKKYFVWQENGTWYSICYSSQYTSGEYDKQLESLSQDNIEKISSSLMDLSKINNVNYSMEKEELSTECALMAIYDKDDLKEAENILGFNPKMPLKINDDITIKQSAVGICGDSDIENNNIKYELNSFYSNKEGSITFNQSKADAFNKYDSIKKNGYVTETYLDENNQEREKKINVEKVEFSDKEVFKYLENSENGNDAVYMWKDGDIYYSLCFFNANEDCDEIAEEFVNSKTIE
ncbi:MAG: peptidase M56, BlaR1 [Clostridium sp.]|nr:peptidase M56, BlaR1 [Clostridium sp.]